MLVASWNVNSVRVRLPQLLDWLAERKPDVACLQELKTEEDEFPRLDLQAAGYRSIVHGQRAYNGVALLLREDAGWEATDIRRGFAVGADDGEARLVGACLRRTGSDPRWAYSVYVPNGQSVGSDKWAGKLQWLARLRAHLAAVHQPSDLVVLGGDWNVAPQDLDIRQPMRWGRSVLAHPDVRVALADLLSWGLQDSLRVREAGGGFYSWWDYRMGAFKKDDGVRIDLLLATAPLAARCAAAGIDRGPRALKLPSDHTPVWARYETGPT